MARAILFNFYLTQASVWNTFLTIYCEGMNLLTQQEQARVKTAADSSVEQLAEQAPKARWPSWVRGEWLAAMVSGVLLAAGLTLHTTLEPDWFTTPVQVLWYGLAYMPVGAPVVWRGIKLALRGDVFTEFFLMSIATLGAFYVGSYAEGVAVMLFYAVGELFQGAAVNRAKRSIKALLDVRPRTASVFRDGSYREVNAADVQLNEMIQVKVGQRVPLDGVMLSDGSSFNTAALTGESKPALFRKGDAVLAGMINEAKVIELRVSSLFHESSLAKIISFVEGAQRRKAKTELFIRRFARVYTPVVVGLALLLTFLPYFLVSPYQFDEWLYRALIFLVISCPCALVVAIPLGYFGGIGAASRHGILFKGSAYLDALTRVRAVAWDKTGTLTKGVFEVTEVVDVGMPAREWLPLLAALESYSTHPVAKAILSHVAVAKWPSAEGVEELRGYGLRGLVAGREVVAGNARLCDKFNIAVPAAIRQLRDTTVVVAIDGHVAGYLVIADSLKDDAHAAITALHQLGIASVMLSGDKQANVEHIAQALRIDQAHGDLLPGQKLEHVAALREALQQPLAFVGDGINDAPALALSDVGIAMGALGSDVAIETADVVVQTDQPAKVVAAIKIGKATNAIVWQNIAMAFGIKIMVMALGAWGLASMWEAVFADVGVALLAIGNAVRIQRMRF